MGMIRSRLSTRISCVDELGARLTARSYRGQAASLHGAEHQALNCLRRGLPLTDANIAQSPTASVQCDTSLWAVDQAVFTVAAVTLELWLPGWPLPAQLLAGSAVWLLARAVASELAMREVDLRVSGRRSLLGPSARIGMRRQTHHTTRPGGPEHREVAARALEPVLPADQQAQLGPRPPRSRRSRSTQRPRGRFARVQELTTVQVAGVFGALPLSGKPPSGSLPSAAASVAPTRPRADQRHLAASPARSGAPSAVRRSDGGGEAKPQGRRNLTHGPGQPPSAISCAASNGLAVQAG